MNTCTANPSHWTQDPDQRERFFQLLNPPIEKMTNLCANRWRVSADQQDIAQDLRAELVQRMNEMQPPFDRATPEDTIQALITNYDIWNPSRMRCRNAARQHSRQARILASVPTESAIIPKDQVSQFMDCAEKISAMVGECGLTACEREIFCLEVARLSRVEDLPQDCIEATEQLLRLKPGSLRSHLENYRQNPRVSPNKRKSLSRARAKIRIRGIFRSGRWTGLLLIAAAMLWLWIAESEHTSILAHHSLHQATIAMLASHPSSHEHNLLAEHQPNHELAMLASHPSSHEHNLLAEHQPNHELVLLASHPSKYSLDMNSVIKTT